MLRRRRIKNCQSCGMPLSRDDREGGTNVDGSKNEMYCSHCYQRGRFVMPNITVQQMQERVKTKLAGAGAPRLLAALLTRRIPRLKRWRSES
jgi:Putative zinc ribbon domain